MAEKFHQDQLTQARTASVSHGISFMLGGPGCQARGCQALVLSGCPYALTGWEEVALWAEFWAPESASGISLAGKTHLS